MDNDNDAENLAGIFERITIAKIVPHGEKWCQFYDVCTLDKMPYWCEDGWKANSCSEHQRMLESINTNNK